MERALIILAGRDIAESDNEQSERAAIVNETLAKRFLAQTNPIGHQLKFGKANLRIVGVVRDSKYTSVDEEPRPMAHYAVMQFKALGTLHVEVRTRGEATTLLPAIKKIVSSMYPDVPLEQPMAPQEQFEKSYAQQRMFAALGGGRRASIRCGRCGRNRSKTDTIFRDQIPCYAL
ncbi:MAG TPA: ABC transporter permease [Terracidiphilus sp.]